MLPPSSAYSHESDLLVLGFLLNSNSGNGGGVSPAASERGRGGARPQIGGRSEERVVGR